MKDIMTTWGGFELTPEQLGCHRALDDWMRSRDKHFVVNGIAGSSKSFTILSWLDYKGLRCEDVVIASPTNNLAEEIALKTNYFSTTIHSLLGFRPDATSQEMQVLKRNGKAKIIPQRLVIVDEAYYSPTILIHSLMTEYPTLKIVFLGDTEQLAPIAGIGDKELNFENARELDSIDARFHLSDNMRAKDCPEQVDLCWDIRHNGWDSQLLKKYTVDSFDGQMAFRELVKQKYQTVNGVCGVAYTHAVVSKLADQTRKAVYGYKPGLEPQVGELIRVSQTINLDKEILVKANEVVKVLKYAPDMMVVERPNGLQVLLDVDCDGLLDRLKNEAKTEKDGKLRKGKWRDYYEKEPLFVKVFSPWNRTCHSSQGATYETGLVDLSNIAKANDEKLLYVAVSRFKTVPILIG